MFEMLPSGSLLLALLTLGGFFVGVFSLFLTIYLYNKSRNFKKIKYAKKGYSITYKINPNVGKLYLEYAGKIVESVTITFLAIWNSGNDTIYSSDFLKTAPLSVYSTNNSNILEISIIYFSNKLSDFKIKEEDKNAFNVLFNYVENNEGVILKIIHTGESSKSIAVNCRLKSGERPALVKFIDYGAKLLYEKKSSNFLLLLSLVFAVIESVIFINFATVNYSFTLPSTGITIFAIFILASLNYTALAELSKFFVPRGWSSLDDFDIYKERYRKNK